jgi:hypothetical protein
MAVSSCRLGWLWMAIAIFAIWAAPDFPEASLTALVFAQIHFATAVVLKAIRK